MELLPRKCNIYLFSVISCKSQFPNYISALLPQDQIFEPESDFQFEPTPVKKKKEQKIEETEEGQSSIHMYENKFKIDGYYLIEL